MTTRFEEWEAERLRDPEFLAALAARYPEHERARAQVQLNIMRAALKTALDALREAPTPYLLATIQESAIKGRPPGIARYTAWYNGKRQRALGLATDG